MTFGTHLVQPTRCNINDLIIIPVSSTYFGQNNYPKHAVLTGIINKPLLLHLVGCLYYLYQWCTVKQVSDNEIYLLIKCIKNTLWRVAKCLSYIEEARCLKVNSIHTELIILGLHVSTSDGSSSGPHNIDPDIQMFNVLWDPQRSQIISVHYKSIQSTVPYGKWVYKTEYKSYISLNFRVFYCRKEVLGAHGIGNCWNPQPFWIRW